MCGFRCKGDGIMRKDGMSREENEVVRETDAVGNEEDNGARREKFFFQ